MNKRRKQLLRELGLSPIWHLKSDTSEQNEISASSLTEIKGSILPPADVTKDTQDSQPIHLMNWDQLKSAVSGCMSCPLSQTRTHTVFAIKFISPILSNAARPTIEPQVRARLDSASHT